MSDFRFSTLIKGRNWEYYKTYKRKKNGRRYRGRKERKALRFLKTAKRVLVLEAAATLVLSLSRGSSGAAKYRRRMVEGRKGR